MYTYTSYTLMHTDMTHTMYVLMPHTHIHMPHMHIYTLYMPYIQYAIYSHAYVAYIYFTYTTHTIYDHAACVLYTHTYVTDAKKVWQWIQGLRQVVAKSVECFVKNFVEMWEQLCKELES